MVAVVGATCRSTGPSTREAISRSYITACHSDSRIPTITGVAGFALASAGSSAITGNTAQTAAPVATTITQTTTATTTAPAAPTTSVAVQTTTVTAKASTATKTVTKTEAPRAASSIPGDFQGALVGTDLEAGTYHSGTPDSGNCYWEISSDANGSNIVQNNNSAGSSTVSLRRGQYSTSQGCSDWARR
jgi:hypothetical protein